MLVVPGLPAASPHAIASRAPAPSSEASIVPLTLIMPVATIPNGTSPLTRRFPVTSVKSVTTRTSIGPASPSIRTCVVGITVPAFFSSCELVL